MFLRPTKFLITAALFIGMVLVSLSVSVQIWFEPDYSSQFRWSIFGFSMAASIFYVWFGWPNFKIAYRFLRLRNYLKSASESLLVEFPEGNSFYRVPAKFVPKEVDQQDGLNWVRNYSLKRYYEVFGIEISSSYYYLRDGVNISPTSLGEMLINDLKNLKITDLAYHTSHVPLHMSLDTMLVSGTFRQRGQTYSFHKLVATRAHEAWQFFVAYDNSLSQMHRISHDFISSIQVRLKRVFAHVNLDELNDWQEHETQEDIYHLYLPIDLLTTDLPIESTKEVDEQSHESSEDFLDFQVASGYFKFKNRWADIATDGNAVLQFKKGEFGIEGYPRLSLVDNDYMNEATMHHRHKIDGQWWLAQLQVHTYGPYLWYTWIHYREDEVERTLMASKILDSISISTDKLEHLVDKWLERKESK